MSIHKGQPYFLLFLIIASAFLAFSILRPFLIVLALAIIFATVLTPIYKILLVKLKGREALATFVTMLLLVIFVLTPFIILSTQILQEAQSLFSILRTSVGQQQLVSFVNTAMGDVATYVPGLSEFTGDISQYLNKGLTLLLAHLGGIFAGVAGLIASFAIFLISLFYLLKDGHKLRQAVVRLSPLSDRDDNAVLDKLTVAINSVVRGGLLVAIIQGALTALGFLIFGVPNPFLWGSLAAVSALIPGIGTALVLVPAILFLFATAHTIAGVGLLVWGVLAVGTVDNILGPKLLGQGVKVHPLLILLSVLGGLAYFGPLGFLLGPLVMSFLVALLDVYFTRVGN